MRQQAYSLIQIRIKACNHSWATQQATQPRLPLSWVLAAILETLLHPLHPAHPQEAEMALNQMKDNKTF